MSKQSDSKHRGTNCFNSWCHKGGNIIYYKIALKDTNGTNGHLLWGFISSFPVHNNSEGDDYLLILTQFIWTQNVGGSLVSIAC